MHATHNFGTIDSAITQLEAYLYLDKKNADGNEKREKGRMLEISQNMKRECLFSSTVLNVLWAIL
jgi:hypothetical protein